MIACEQLMNVKRKYPRLRRPGRVTNMKELLGRNNRIGWEFLLIKTFRVLASCFLLATNYYDCVVIGVPRPSWFTEILL